MNPLCSNNACNSFRSNWPLRASVDELLKSLLGKQDCLLLLLQAEKAERREKNLEEAKKIVIEQDSSLPAPKLVSA